MPIEPIYAVIGENIRRLRQRAAMRQYHLTQVCGFESAATISHIERAETRVALHILCQIAQYFEVDVCDLLKGTHATARRPSSSSMSVSSGERKPTE